MTPTEIKQFLLKLENRDIVKIWYRKIHDRELSERRTIEINSSAKQFSEYFRNAEKSSYIVKPLLLFYGITSLSKSLILLLKKKGGEETFKNSHGLHITNWNNVLRTQNFSDGLRNIGNLEIEIENGLFYEFIRTTENKTLIHLNGSDVDFALSYDIPNLGNRYSLNEFISRIPDFNKDINDLTIIPQYASMHGLTYSEGMGLNLSLFKCNIYLEDYLYRNNFTKTSFDEYSNLTNFNAQADDTSLFILHEYLSKTIGAIPNPKVVVPFNNNQCLSELSIAYIISYYLGMLVRYYPTHWTALVQGSNGDVYWPVLNRAIRYTENVFPELIVEFIQKILKDSSQPPVN